MTIYDDFSETTPTAAPGIEKAADGINVNGHDLGKDDKPQHNVPLTEESQGSGDLKYPRVVLFHGNNDTQIHKPGSRYQTINYPEITEMAAAPSCEPKDSAPAMIASIYIEHDARNHQRQREAGEYAMMAADIDTGNHAPKAVRAAAAAIAAGGGFLIYSSARAEPQNRKWRVIFPLADTIPGEDYNTLQRALFSLFADHGITCDNALDRTGQPIYLPNVPVERRNDDGNPKFYMHHVEPGEPVTIGNGSAIGARVAKLLAADRAERARAEEEAAKRAAGRQKPEADGKLTPTQWFNSEHTVEQLLIRYNYKTDRRGNWQSPHQTSGSYATTITEDGEAWVSMSQSDRDKGLGAVAKSGASIYGDAFDLFCHFEHGGDHSAAWSEIRRQMPREDRGDDYSGFEAEPGVGATDGGDKGDKSENDAAARRDRQRAENREIGAGTVKRLKAELITLETALKRFVFLADGSRVVDLERPIFDLSFGDFAATYCASKETLKRGKKEEEEKVPVAPLWRASPSRITMFTKTFRPDAGVYTRDPDGRTAVNTWRPYQRDEPSEHYEKNVAKFTEHVDYLFGDDADRFLDWIAHIEQQPGVLPHTAWLHVSEQTGTGRNALSGILTRIWRGHVAASIDLVSILKTGFNGRLSSKLLAVVDEIKEGGRDSPWELSERLKSFVTEPERTINPKYGRQSVEFNCCRLLMFSNHAMALPIAENDRRIEVVLNKGEPRSPAYYAGLYKAVDRPQFINDVALWLKARDISAFTPGARAKNTDAKVEVARASESEGMAYARALAAHWPADIAPSSFVSKIIDPSFEGRTTAAIRAISTDARFKPLPKAIRFDGQVMRVTILRNVERWLQAGPPAMAREMRRGDWRGVDARAVLDEVIAGGDKGD